MLAKELVSLQLYTPDVWPWNIGPDIEMSNLNFTAAGIWGVCSIYKWEIMQSAELPSLSPIWLIAQTMTIQFLPTSDSSLQF
jgi:hypothetical protein